MDKVAAVGNPPGLERIHTRLYESVRRTVFAVNALIDAGGSGGGTTVLAGALVATVPGPAGRYEHEEVLAATGVTASMKVMLSLAPHSDADENNEQALDMRGLAGEAGTDTITVRLAFGSLTSGPIRLNFMAV